MDALHTWASTAASQTKGTLGQRERERAEALAEFNRLQSNRFRFCPREPGPLTPAALLAWQLTAAQLPLLEQAQARLRATVEGETLAREAAVRAHLTLSLVERRQAEKQVQAERKQTRRAEQEVTDFYGTRHLRRSPFGEATSIWA